MSKLTKHYNEIRNRNIISIQVNLLNECTSKCKYCRKYTWPKDVLDINVLKKTILFLKDNHALRSITFSGGDPILYPHIVELLQYCEQLNIATSLITTLITDDMLLLSNIAKLATRLHVSVDGPTKELYLQTRGVDKFEIVKKNILFVNDIRLSMHKIPIRISSTISNINENSLILLYMLAEETGSTINYYFIHRYEKFNPNTNTIHNELQCIYDMDEDEISNVSAIINKQFTNDYYSIKSNYCNIPYIHCLINANGDVYPCCKLLNDNGEYGEQVKYVYGNIYNEMPAVIFAKTNQKTKCIDTDCNGCEERYIPFIDEVNEIMNDKGDAAFL